MEPGHGPAEGIRFLGDRLHVPASVVLYQERRRLAALNGINGPDLVGEKKGESIMDVQITPSLAIPAAELKWHFSRSSGPGGQHVNTSDSRVELAWVIGASRALSDWQRQRLLEKLGPRLVAGALRMAVNPVPS